MRDDHDALMQHFLTNGGKAIPKLIVLDAETHEVLGDWGPRPEEAKQLILDYKASHGVVDEPAKIALQKWYVQNKGVAIQNEVMNLHEYKSYFIIPIIFNLFEVEIPPGLHPNFPSGISILNWSNNQPKLEKRLWF